MTDAPKHIWCMPGMPGYITDGPNDGVYDVQYTLTDLAAQAERDAYARGVYDAHPTCATCAHFIPPSETESEVTAHKGKGECLKTEHSAEVTEWDEDWNDSIKEEFKDCTAFVADGSGYSATLIPAPEHYCPMHSALTGPMQETRQ